MKSSTGFLHNQREFFANSQPAMYEVTLNYLIVRYTC